MPEVREAVERQLATGVVHTSTLYLIRARSSWPRRSPGCPASRTPRCSSPTPAPRPTRPRCCSRRYARSSNQVLALRNSYHGRSFGAIGDHRQPRLVSTARCRRSTCSYLHGGDRLPQPVPRAVATPTTSRPASTTCATCSPPPTARRRGRADRRADPGRRRLHHAARRPVRRVQEVLDEHGILFISDEVQTGWGRTGEHFWGYPGARRHAGHADLRQGPRQRLRDRRRRRPRRADGLRCTPTRSRTFGGNPLSTAGRARHPATTCSTTTCRPTPPATGATCIDGLRDGRRRACRSSARCAARA